MALQVKHSWDFHAFRKELGRGDDSLVAVILMRNDDEARSNFIDVLCWGRSGQATLDNMAGGEGD